MRSTLLALQASVQQTVARVRSCGAALLQAEVAVKKLSIVRSFRCDAEILRIAQLELDRQRVPML